MSSQETPGTPPASQESDKTIKPADDPGVPDESTPDKEPSPRPESPKEPTPDPGEASPVQPNDRCGEKLEALWKALKKRDAMTVSDALVSCHLLFHDVVR